MPSPPLPPVVLPALPPLLVFEEPPEAVLEVFPPFGAPPLEVVLALVLLEFSVEPPLPPKPPADVAVAVEGSSRLSS